MKDLPYRDKPYDTREAAVDEHKGPEGQHTCQPDGIDGSLVRRYLSGEPHRHGEQRRIDERGDGGLRREEEGEEPYAMTQRIDEGQEGEVEDEADGIDREGKG